LDGIEGSVENSNSCGSVNISAIAHALQKLGYAQWMMLGDKLHFHGLQVLDLGTAEDNLYQQSPFPCLSFYTIHAYISVIMRKYIQNSQIFQYLLFKINIYSKVSCR
jgi:hypothetical protein